VHTDEGVDTQRAVYSGYYGGCLFFVPIHPISNFNFMHVQAGA
jgi:hypothetical protein